MATPMEDTIAVLGGLFKKPKMSEKLLGKPPFRFLHDCVSATMKAVDTGFAEGLFDESEMDSKGFADKQGKCDFLDKVINYVGICSGERLDVRSTKVVAGLEPDATNILLATMGRVASNPDIDHAEATQRTLNNESPGDRTAPMKGGASAPPAAEAKEPSPSRPSAAPAAQSKSLDDDGDVKKGDDFAPSGAAASFAEEAKRASATDGPSTRSGTRGGARDRGAAQTSDAGLGEAPSLSPAKTGGMGGSSLDQEIEECNSDPDRTRSMMEKIVKKPKCSDKLLGKPPFRFLHDLISAVIKNTGFGEGLYPEEMLDSKNVKEKSAKIQYLETIIQAVGAHLNTIVDARPAKIVAGLEAENTCRFLQLLALAATNQGGAGGSEGGGGGEEQGSRSPAKQEEPAAEAKSPEPQAAVAPPKHESPQAQAKQEKDEDVKGTPSGSGGGGASNNSSSAGGSSGGGQAAPKSMRPTTARRRPPKVKENTSVTSVQETVTHNKNVKKVAIMKEGGDEDDFYKDDGDDDGVGMEEAKGGDIGDDEGRSALVKNIMKEQEEEKRERDKEEGGKDEGKKGIRLKMSLNKGGVQGGMSASDLENLTKAVQRLVQSTAPLGKCMDYVQEDLTQMTKEGERWGNHFRSNIDAFLEAKKRTEEDLTPLKSQLRDLEDQVEEMKERIRGTKTNIVKNDERVKSLLRGVVSN
ncbi:hypothetical protein TrRE_jg12709 [Triparma retinervis]|uniref:TRAF3-interacting protein 1 n=1 Tax=Triparma retinervis TaxID=2557542 RepID=A0A9W6ZZA4_9STRA|nr:hypothetical protein TrRE_jg12709 [Triparma retinervis]